MENKSYYYFTAWISKMVQVEGSHFRRLWSTRQAQVYSMCSNRNHFKWNPLEPINISILYRLESWQNFQFVWRLENKFVYSAGYQEEYKKGNLKMTKAGRWNKHVTAKVWLKVCLSSSFIWRKRQVFMTFVGRKLSKLSSYLAQLCSSASVQQASKRHRQLY